MISRWWCSLSLLTWECLSFMYLVISPYHRILKKEVDDLLSREKPEKGENHED